MRRRHKAIGVDAGLKEANQNRLRRIEGQIRGLQKMIEEDRYCADVITQIASVQEALRGVARNLMKNHMRHCAAKAIGSGRKEEKEAMYEELLGLMDLQRR
jgi:DNA-binding FrmR family transcriptional regulator